MLAQIVERYYKFFCKTTDQFPYTVFPFPHEVGGGGELEHNAEEGAFRAIIIFLLYVKPFFTQFTKKRRGYHLPVNHMKKKKRTNSYRFRSR